VKEFRKREILEKSPSFVFKKGAQN